jgi:hypothetical protein
MTIRAPGWAYLGDRTGSLSSDSFTTECDLEGPVVGVDMVTLSDSSSVSEAMALKRPISGLFESFTRQRQVRLSQFFDWSKILLFLRSNEAVMT